MVAPASNVATQQQYQSSYSQQQSRQQYQTPAPPPHDYSQDMSKVQQQDSSKFYKPPPLLPTSGGGGSYVSMEGKGTVVSPSSITSGTSVSESVSRPVSSASGITSVPQSIGQSIQSGNVTISSQDAGFGAYAAMHGKQQIDLQKGEFYRYDRDSGSRIAQPIFDVTSASNVFGEELNRLYVTKTDKGTYEYEKNLPSTIKKSFETRLAQTGYKFQEGSSNPIIPMNITISQVLPTAKLSTTYTPTSVSSVYSSNERVYGISGKTYTESELANYYRTNTPNLKMSMTNEVAAKKGADLLRTNLKQSDRQLGDITRGFNVGGQINYPMSLAGSEEVSNAPMKVFTQDVGAGKVSVTLPQSYNAVTSFSGGTSTGSYTPTGIIKSVTNAPFGIGAFKEYKESGKAGIWSDIYGFTPSEERKKLGLTTSGALGTFYDVGTSAMDITFGTAKVIASPVVVGGMVAGSLLNPPKTEAQRIEYGTNLAYGLESLSQVPLFVAFSAAGKGAAGEMPILNPNAKNLINKPFVSGLSVPELERRSVTTGVYSITKGGKPIFSDILGTSSTGKVGRTEVSDILGKRIESYGMPSLSDFKRSTKMYVVETPFGKNGYATADIGGVKYESGKLGNYGFESLTTKVTTKPPSGSLSLGGAATMGIFGSAFDTSGRIMSGENVSLGTIGTSFAGGVISYPIFESTGMFASKYGRKAINYVFPTEGSYKARPNVINMGTDTGFGGTSKGQVNLGSMFGGARQSKGFGESFELVRYRDFGDIVKTNNRNIQEQKNYPLFGMGYQTKPRYDLVDITRERANVERVNYKDMLPDVSRNRLPDVTRERMLDTTTNRLPDINRNVLPDVVVGRNIVVPSKPILPEPVRPQEIIIPNPEPSPPEKPIYEEYKEKPYKGEEGGRGSGIVDFPFSPVALGGLAFSGLGAGGETGGHRASASLKSGTPFNVLDILSVSSLAERSYGLGQQPQYIGQQNIRQVRQQTRQPDVSVFRSSKARKKK